MIRCRPIALLAAMLVLGIVSTPDANAQPAVVGGVARAEDSGAPVPFALVRLVSADSTAQPWRGTVRLDFDDVPVAGAMLRMPVGGAFAWRPSQRNPAKRTEGKLTYTYSGFEEVPPR